MFGSGPSVGRVWTAEDLEPTSVLGYTGSLRKGFSGGDTRGYTMASPNLPMFRADMAQRSQALNFIAEMAASANRQAFQSRENELERQSRERMAADAAGVKVGGLDVRRLALVQDMPPGPLRDRAIDDIPGLTPAQKVDLKYGSLISSEKLTKNTIGSLAPYLSEGSDYAGLATALAEKRGITPAVLSGRMYELTDPGFWSWNRFTNRLSPNELEPEKAVEYNILQRLLQAQQPRR